MGQTNIARCLQGIIHKISKKIKTLNIGPSYVDDFVRKNLKHIHNYFFPKVSENIGNMMLCHLHTLGGPSPYTTKQIHQDMDSWVKGEIDTFPRDWILSKLDSVFASTKKLHQSLSLTFEEYSKDVMRWATSGGAPAVEFRGTKMRSKWAWGFSKLGDITSDHYGEELYKAACNTEGVYTVALKREPAKTREIISSPMGSHIRQSYLLYRMTNWDIPSPAYQKMAYQTYLDKQYGSYCSIDGDRFDHNVPRWFVLEFIRRLGFDAETQRVVEMELEHLHKAVLHFGPAKWRWEHGLLSGWRLTSLLGSTISHLAAMWIKERTRYFCQHLVLGDDIILFSDIDDLDVNRCVAEYRSFGIPANADKSISGRVGEFLRKVATPTGIIGYPALALKSIYYASPWLDQYQRSVQSEISHSWWTYVSRILPFRTDNSVILSTIERMGRDIWFREDEFYKWVQTPMCLGGGGVMETSAQQYWLAYLTNVSKNIDREAYFYSIFGIGDKHLHRKYSFKKMVPSNSHYRFDSSNIPIKPSIPDSVNKTKTIMRWYLLQLPNSYLQKQGISFSKSLRGLTNTKLMELMLGQSDKMTSVVSLLHVGEQMSEKIGGLTQMISSMRPRGPVSKLVPDMYMYLERFLSNKRYSLVTW
jgi:hypothetical protein